MEIDLDRACLIVEYAKFLPRRFALPIIDRLAGDIEREWRGSLVGRTPATWASEGVKRVIAVYGYLPSKCFWNQNRTCSFRSHMER